VVRVVAPAHCMMAGAVTPPVSARTRRFAEAGPSQPKCAQPQPMRVSASVPQFHQLQENWATVEELPMSAGALRAGVEQSLEPMRRDLSKLCRLVGSRTDTIEGQVGRLEQTLDKRITALEEHFMGRSPSPLHRPTSSADADTTQMSPGLSRSTSRASDWTLAYGSSTHTLGSTMDGGTGGTAALKAAAAKAVQNGPPSSRRSKKSPSFGKTDQTSGSPSGKRREMSGDPVGARRSAQGADAACGRLNVPYSPRDMMSTESRAAPSSPRRPSGPTSDAPPRGSCTQPQESTGASSPSSPRHSTARGSRTSSWSPHRKHQQRLASQRSLATLATPRGVGDRRPPRTQDSRVPRRSGDSSPHQDECPGASRGLAGLWSVASTKNLLPESPRNCRRSPRSERRGWDAHGWDGISRRSLSKRP